MAKSSLLRRRDVILIIIMLWLEHSFDFLIGSLQKLADADRVGNMTSTAVPDEIRHICMHLGMSELLFWHRSFTLFTNGSDRDSFSSLFAST